MSSEKSSHQAGVLSFAIGAKGAFKVFERVRHIWKRYGFSTRKMDDALYQFWSILSEFDSSATFPIPALVVQRNPEVIRKYQAKGIEFALHGLRHIDYSQLTYDEQLKELAMAKEIFSAAGIHFSGFRTPYLRRDSALNRAIEDQVLSYSSNQPIIWDALDLDSLEAADRKNYSLGLDFYKSWSANDRISMPILRNGVVRIPVTLPDDEMLLDRLETNGQDYVYNAWSYILDQTHQRGELFTLQLHPERIGLCADSLASILKSAREMEPRVWIATLNEIDQWWRKRLEVKVSISDISDGQFLVSINESGDIPVLVKNIEADSIGEHYFGDYSRAIGPEFTFRSAYYPGIGLSGSCYDNWNEFLRQQGYLVEKIKENRKYTYRIDQDSQNGNSELEMIANIESATNPLIRIGIWPTGYQSALSVTGDLDGLTLWDYFLRLGGK